MLILRTLGVGVGLVLRRIGAGGWVTHIGPGIRGTEGLEVLLIYLAVSGEITLEALPRSCLGGLRLGGRVGNLVLIRGSRLSLRRLSGSGSGRSLGCRL